MLGMIRHGSVNMQDGRIAVDGGILYRHVCSIYVLSIPREPFLKLVCT